MKQNTFYVIIGVLLIAVLFLGYQYYVSHRATQGVEIKMDENGVSIQKN